MHTDVDGPGFAAAPKDFMRRRPKLALGLLSLTGLLAGLSCDALDTGGFSFGDLLAIGLLAIGATAGLRPGVQPATRAVLDDRKTDDLGSAARVTRNQREFWRAVADGAIGPQDLETVLTEYFWPTPQKSLCAAFLSVAQERPELLHRLHSFDAGVERMLDEFCAGEFSADESAALLSGHAP